MNTDRTNIPDFVYNVTGSCSIIAFICLNNSYNVPWTLQARRQRSLELAAESKQMPSTGPYNEVIDRADLETAGHPFHISFMAALIRAWRTVSNASQHSRERAWKEEGKKKRNGARPSLFFDHQSIRREEAALVRTFTRSLPSSVRRTTRSAEVILRNRDSVANLEEGSRSSRSLSPSWPDCPYRVITNEYCEKGEARKRGTDTIKVIPRRKE